MMTHLAKCVIITVAANASSQPQRKTLLATRAREPIAIDGRLVEPCWRQAQKATDFGQLRGRDLARPQTVGRVVFDDGNVYIGVECDEPRMDLVREAAERTKGKFDYDDGETIEVFLDVNRDRKTFLQIMLSTSGAIETHTTDPMQVRNAQIEYAVHFGTDRFSLECRIPFAFLHLQPNPARTWGFNICRSRPIEGQPGSDVPLSQVYSAWQNPGSEFRCPERFGDLTIDADLSAYQYTVASQLGQGQAQLRIANHTGNDRDLTLVVSLNGTDEPITKHMRLSPEQEAEAALPRRGSELELDVALKETDTGALRFVGGTQLAEKSFAVAGTKPSSASVPSRGYIVFAKHYLERGSHRTRPRPEQINAPLEIFASQAEYEPASFAVRATKMLRGVRVELAGDLVGPRDAVVPAAAVDIRIAELMTRWLDAGTFERVECFLIRNRARDIPADHTQRYWLTVHVPETAEPGRYETQVRIAPANAEACTIPLRLEVLPFAVGRAEGMNYFMYLHLSYFPPELRTAEYVRRIYDDMREHGMTTATLYAWPSGRGWLSVDRDRSPGNLPMSTQMDLLRDTGLVAPWGAVPWIGAECYGSAAWKMVLDQGQQRGWPELLWYIVDEPNQARLASVEGCMARVADFRQQYPGRPFRTTTAGASNPLVSHYYDVWIAGCYIDDEALARGRKAGKAIWTYDCGLAPVDAITDRHYFGIWTWAAGLKGTSHWAYYDAGMLTRWNLKGEWRDSEDDLREYTHSFNYVYPKSDELIPTVGWEAVREGVDDARYLLALEKVLARAKGAGVAAELMSRGESLLTRVRQAVTVENLGVERTRCKQVTKETGRRGVRDFERRPPEPDLKPTDYDRFRYEAAQQIVALLQALRAKGIELDLRAESPRKTARKLPRWVPSGPVNLLANAGFEVGSDEQASGWKTWVSARVKEPKITRTSETAHTGRHSLRLTDTSACVYQTIKVAPGDAFEIGCWIKRELATGSVMIDIGLIDLSNKWHEGKSTAASSPPLRGSGNWERSVTPLTVPDGVKMAWIKISTSSDVKGQVWIDDVYVHRTNAAPRRVNRTRDASLLEACEDLNKVNAVFRQKHWDPKGTRATRIGKFSISAEHKVEGEGSIHWLVTREDVDAKLEAVPRLSLVALDYLYGRRWGHIDEVCFHIKCENPDHPPLYAMLSASGASPATPILGRGKITNGWKEIRWNVRNAGIGVSEKWGRIVWLIRVYARAVAFKPSDTIDLYVDNIRLVASDARDITPRNTTR